MNDHKLKYLEPHEIKPYFNNPRINEDSVPKVAESIQAYGFQQPILVDEEMVILAGHTRWKAALKLNLAKIPVVISTGLSTEQKRAYRIADNRSGEFAHWDYEKLLAEMTDIEDMPIWFEAGEIEKMISRMAPEPEVSESDEELPSDVPEVCKPGDLWLLGPHRLICGDCTNSDDVERLLDGKKPVLLVTDPPYGVDYDPEWRAKAGINNSKGRMGKVSNDDRTDWSEAYALINAQVAYVWHSGKYASDFQQSLQKAGYDIVNQIIWAKDHFAMSRGDYHWQHEPCWYAVKHGSTHNWQGSRDQTTVWNIQKIDRTEEAFGHSTQKPIPCMMKPILNNTQKGDLVCDPFLGSGTSLIAAVKTDRICYGMDIDVQYCNTILARYEKVTGEKPVLAENLQIDRN